MSAPFVAGEKVRHHRFGVGVVVGWDGDMLVVRFAGVDRRFVSDSAPADDAPSSPASPRGAPVVDLAEYRRRRSVA